MDRANARLTVARPLDGRCLHLVRPDWHYEKRQHESTLGGGVVSIDVIGLVGPEQLELGSECVEGQRIDHKHPNGVDVASKTARSRNDLIADDPIEFDLSPC